MDIIISTKPTKSQALFKKGSKHMEDPVPLPEPDPLPLKTQLSRIVEGMTDWQMRLVLSFVTTLFGSAPSSTTEQPMEV